MLLRREAHSDVPVIRPLIAAAFLDAPHSDGTEAKIVDDLRNAGGLTLSLVALVGDEIVGHVAFSPVTIGDEDWDGFGLGPVGVRRDERRRGIAARLIETGLDCLRVSGAGGCVVLGNPAYYGRFGFVVDPALSYPGPPAAYFQSLLLRGERPAGEVRYNPAFGAASP
jgi:putative acetyltransferase